MRRALGIGLLLALMPVPAAEAQRDRVERLEVRAHDGVVLRGFASLPPLADGRGAPTLLVVSPYDGTYDPGLEDPLAEDVAVGRSLAVPVREALRRGYAVVNLNVRGTGDSGGCFGLFSRDEQRDMRTVVEAVAAQPWSDGRVGMLGVSYDATTAIAAAAAAPEALKAIAVAGVSYDLYSVFFSPQGSPYDDQWPGIAPFYLPTQAGRRPTTDPAQQSLLAGIASRPERLCAGYARAVERGAGEWASDDRDRAFWAERDMTDRLDDVRAAVLLAHGQQDHISFPDDRFFAALARAPKLQVTGPWGHRLPTDAQRPGFSMLLWEWFDHFVKRAAPPPKELGEVEYTDDAGVTRRSRTWPPAEAVEQPLALPLGSFVAARDRAPVGLGPRALPDAYAPPCGPHAGTRLEQATEPLVAPMTLAGNPVADLSLKSDRPAGRFSLRLYELRHDSTCAGNRATSSKFLSEGTVDLRFHDRRYEGRPFPTERVMDVRVDLQSVVESIDAGSRLLVVIDRGQHATGGAELMPPKLTLKSGTLRLPVVP